MATPTPSLHTPQKHLGIFSSPAPRSHPSIMNFDSPAALALPLEGGVGMNLSMSGLSGLGLGATASGMSRNNENDRRKRLETVLATLASRPGRVSEEGIVRLCENEGLKVMKEGSSERKILTILIGNEIMVDVRVALPSPGRGADRAQIALQDGEVDKVQLLANSDTPEVPFGSTGSDILARDLRPLPGQSRLNLSLERFASNLDQLVRIDKLSTPEVKCFHAVLGVYSSLRRLFEHEKQTAMAMAGSDAPDAEAKAEREVLSKKSGRPSMNSGSSLGFGLQYWMERRHLLSKRAKSQKTANGKAPADDTDTDQNIYSLSIECEQHSASLYQPIRVSDEWIAPEIRADMSSDPTDPLYSPVAWLDPPTTFLGSARTGADVMDMDGGPGRLPDIRFVAKLKPPLIVPQSVATAIHQAVSHPMPQTLRPLTFVGLALRPNEAELASEQRNEVHSERRVLAVGQDGREQDTLHVNSLFLSRSEDARVVEELPFHHPRQLVELLPVSCPPACGCEPTCPDAPPIRLCNFAAPEYICTSFVSHGGGYKVGPIAPTQLPGRHAAVQPPNTPHCDSLRPRQHCSGILGIIAQEKKAERCITDTQPAEGLHGHSPASHAALVAFAGGGDVLQQHADGSHILPALRRALCRW